MAAPNKGSRRSSGAQSKPGRALVLILVAMVALVGGMFATGSFAPRLGIDLAGGTSFTLEAQNQPGHPNAINPTNMKTATDIISNRVNGLGVSEAEVQTQGDSHIIVNIPKGTNAKQAREQVGTTAQLTFRPVLTAAQVTSTPSQNPSPSGSGKPTSSPTAGSGASGKSGGSKASGASPSSSTQGRAVTSGLLKKDAASPTPKSTGTAAQPSSPATQTPATGVSAAVQKKLDALECSTPAERSKAAKQAAAAKPGDTVVSCDKNGQAKYALGPVAVEGKDVDNAKSSFDSQQGQGWMVNLGFNSAGAKKFTDVTGKLAGQQPPQNQFAIVLDGETVSAPSVDKAIPGGQATISGSFTQQSSEDLANVLSYGALPLSFHIADETTVTAALGSQQLEAGLVAGAIGFALVLIYLVAYYRGLSLVALASLVVSAILTYTIMTVLGPAIGFALNLPAVCGAIVAIGITADSFIVYFERIRDEVREGRSLRPSVERAWPRARRTIMVSDFVSFLAAAVLFIVTVGKVQGFAFTLGLTTLLDVVVVFLFTKPLMTLLARRTFFSGGHPWSGLDPKRLGAKPPLRSRRRTPLTETKEA